MNQVYDLGQLGDRVTIDFERGRYQYGVLTADIQLEFISLPILDAFCYLTLEFRQDEQGGHTIRWPVATTLLDGKRRCIK